MDCLAASFRDDTVKAMHLARQLQATIVPRMTSAMQLADNDFSFQFKNHVRRKVDEILKNVIREKAKRDPDLSKSNSNMHRP